MQRPNETRYATMKVQINAKAPLGTYSDPTKWQNSTLRYTPPEDFPSYLESRVGQAEIMRVWVTLDEYWDYRTDTYYPDYEIGKARYPVTELHYPYDWKNIVPAPSGTRFCGYLTSHAAHAKELLLNVRRLEREVSDGVITYEQYEAIFERAVEHCKALAPNIRYVECCNEVDLKSFGRLSAEEYCKIYLCAYRAVTRLNERHGYEMPLELGGFAIAEPLVHWDLVRDVMTILKQSEICECPMAFYSYHLYNVPASKRLFTDGKPEIASLGGVGKLRVIAEWHRQLLRDLSLPEKPVFLNELGKASTTGVDGDSLHNAAGILTYLIAWSDSEFDDVYFFPWCTFHNPVLQMSFTQFLLNEDGSYSATPNGLAVELLHSLKGTRLRAAVSQCDGPDVPYRALAVADGDVLNVLCINPTGETVACDLELFSLPDGTYRCEQLLCDRRFNNVVTGNGDGFLRVTSEVECATVNGRLTRRCVLEKDAFVLFRISPKS